MGRISIHEKDTTAIGNQKKIRELLKLFSFSEIIFCEGSLSFKEIIESLQQLPGNITAKFHAAGSQSVVGSDSKHMSGETLTKENGYNLSDPNNRRLKRLLDIFTSFLFVLTFPVHLFFAKKPLSFFRNCFLVLSGYNTWIGYATNEEYLPPLRKGVLACNGIHLSLQQQFPEESLKMADLWYAKDYAPLNDLRIIFRVYRRLGG